LDTDMGVYGTVGRHLTKHSGCEKCAIITYHLKLYSLVRYSKWSLPMAKGVY